MKLKKFSTLRNEKQPTVVSLFSGCGGLDLGFINAGYKILWANDNDINSCLTYEKNIGHKPLCKNIEDVNIRDIPKADIVIGGVPCQGFSMAGRLGRKFVDDPRNHLFKEFVKIVEFIQPKYFVMENVARLFNHNYGSTRIEILNSFEKIGYKVDCKVLNSADYGVPQKRKRIIFIGNNKNKVNIFPEPIVKNYKTVKQAIGNLPPLDSGQVSSIKNHEAMNHTQAMLQKMKHIRDGGNRYQIPIKLRPTSGDPRKYIRYDSKLPSFCITGDMRKIFHYSQNRALTVRELARLQSFPDDFVFYGTKLSQQQQVGNAVPPLMAEVIAKNVLVMEENEHLTIQIS